MFFLMRKEKRKCACPEKNLLQRPLPFLLWENWDPPSFLAAGEAL
jgi:hypothetical protein